MYSFLLYIHQGLVSGRKGGNSYFKSQNYFSPSSFVIPAETKSNFTGLKLYVTYVLIYAANGF